MPNFFKKLYSYINPIVIESYSSDVNADLHILLSKGRYMLCAENAVYSYEDKYINFKRAFEEIDIKKHPFEKVLILGFGLGSIPILMEQIYGRTFDITGVELDENIVYLAQQYGMPKIKSAVKLQIANARTYVDVVTEKYDLVISDIFINDEVPQIFETEEYCNRLQELLTEDGLVLYNRLYHTSKTTATTDLFINDVFSKKGQVLGSTQIIKPPFL